VDPQDYDSPNQYYEDAIVTDFARKSPPLEGDLHQTAVDTFYRCEATCAATNARLDKYIDEQGPFEPLDAHVLHHIGVWRKIVKRVLGPLPRRLNLRFSPGSTVGTKGDRITIPDKIATLPVYYPNSVCLSKFVDETAWGRLHQTRAPHVVTANHFFSVPKDAKKNRGCCKEALGSVALQLAVGSVIRSRLKEFGVDLDTGQDLHRQLARAASVTGSRATIDLSNASDTVSKTLVRLILPDEWHALLFSLRAPLTEMSDGSRVHLQKFSSMGNGFTFELETLIFFTLAVSLGDSYSSVKVYGDDIIVPTESASRLLSALRFYGFEPNERKTFISGRFRESCGGDFFDGAAVRPHYQKNYLEEPQQWIALHNGLRRLNRPDLTASAENLCLQRLPAAIRRCVGPVVLGDVVLHRKLEACDGEPSHSGWCGRFFRAYTSVPRRLSLSNWHPSVVLASALYGILSDGVSPRGHVKGYKVTRIFVPTRDIVPCE
jgi:hypothetical protein